MNLFLFTARELETAKRRACQPDASMETKTMTNSKHGSSDDRAFQPGSLAALSTHLRDVMRGAKRVRTIRLVITPTVAGEILAHCNKANRKIRPEHVEAIARAMSDEKFPICTLILGAFETPPRLGDGQHRLRAVVESGCPQEFDARVHVDEDAFNLDVLTVDTGRPRTLADRLHIRGLVKHGQEVMAQAMVNVASMFDGTKPHRSKLTPSEEVDYFERYADSIAWALEELPAKRLRAVGLGAAILCHAREPAATNRIIKAALSGTGLGMGTAEHTLHMKVLPELQKAKTVADKRDAIATVMRVIFDGRRGGAPFESAKKKGAMSRIHTRCAQTERAVRHFCGEEVARRFREEG